MITDCNSGIGLNWAERFGATPVRSKPRAAKGASHSVFPQTTARHCLCVRRGTDVWPRRPSAYSGARPIGHYRVPTYVRGKRGEVEVVLEPPAVDNEEEGLGRNAGLRRHYYRIAIPMTEIWPDYRGSGVKSLPHLAIGDRNRSKAAAGNPIRESAPSKETPYAAGFRA